MPTAMVWIARIVGVILGGGAIAHAMGIDEEMYRTIMNFGASIFVYVTAKVIDLFCWFLEFIPALPYAGGYVNALTSMITILARANTFFPVVETCFMLAFTITFLIIFISIKFILKLIPTVG